MSPTLDNDLPRRTAVTVQGYALIAFAFQTLGIVYSDIGTSPLYTLNGIWPTDGPVPPKEDVIGGISAVIWALTLLPLIKYVLITLRFGTYEGEGGTFALYQGLYPPEDTTGFDRTLTEDSMDNKQVSIRSHAPKLTSSTRWPVMIWCLLGTSLTMADGVFTPAVSITNAVEGIAVAKPSSSHIVNPLSIVILVLLFIAQRFGTQRLAALFAPIAFLWFTLLAAIGIYNITLHPGIFRAFDPSRAVLLFVRTKDYEVLAGVLLALTGCEAMFANLGRFNPASIQISFTSIVYPSLILSYLGQGASLIVEGEAVIENIFYRSIPGKVNGPLYWIVFVVALLATYIASQTLITATFSLVQQIVNNKCLPRIRMVYTSTINQGQVYVPLANWTLMVATIIVVSTFKDPVALTNAYGFAVATVMFSTSILIAMQIRYVKRLPIVLALGYLIIFGFFDGLFWGAAVQKVPHGAWVPLVIGVVMTGVMSFWTWAKGLEDEFDRSHRKNLHQFIVTNGIGDDDEIPMSNNNSVLSRDGLVGSIADLGESMLDSKERETMPQYFYYRPIELSRQSASTRLCPEEKRELVRIPTCAIFHMLAKGKGVPCNFVGFIRQWPALPRVVVFLSVCVLPMATVPEEDRYMVFKVRTVEGFYGVNYYLGYRDEFHVQINEIVDRICDVEMRDDPGRASSTIEEIRRVSTSAAHVVPHYYIVSRQINAGKFSAIMNWGRKFLIEEIYSRLVTMFPETSNWLTSADEIIHVGVNAAI